MKRILVLIPILMLLASCTENLDSSDMQSESWNRDIESEYSDLEQEYHALEMAYDELLKDYHFLKHEYNALESTLLEDYVHKDSIDDYIQSNYNY